MKLRPYQLEDVQFITTLEAAGIFNEQRTGKTPTALSALVSKQCTKNVIICPASMLYKWKEEYETWTGNPCVVATGTKVRRSKIIKTQWTHGLVINYEVLRNYKKQIQEGVFTETRGHHAEILAQHPHAVIVDEIHRIRGRKNITAKGVYQLSKIPYRLGLTGTPAPNKPQDVWPIFHFLYPKKFSSYWAFIEYFYVTTTNKVSRHQAAVIEIHGIRPDREATLLALIDSFCTQRKRADVMPWLPTIDVATKIKLPITKHQAHYLKELEEYFETMHVVTQGILDRIIRVRQICNAPALVGLPGSSPKLDWILQYIKDYPDKPILIFSRFTQFLELLGQKSDAVKLFTGKVSYEDREDLKNKFQSGSINVLALQIDAGKEGHTLDRAEVIIFLDQSRPAGDIQQATDRFVATVKSKANTPKEIIHVMMEDTYDEYLYTCVQDGIDETSIINDYKNYMKGRKQND